MNNLSDQQIQLACLLQIAEDCERDLLKYFAISKVKKNDRITASSDPNIAISEILRTRSRAILDKLRSNRNMKSDLIFQFTDASYEVKNEIDLLLLDINALFYLLTMDIPQFPTREAKYRKQDQQLNCHDPGHTNKCCKQCNHPKSEDGSLCSSCKTSFNSCYNDNVPCCSSCNICHNCAKSGNPCLNLKVRKAIHVLKDVRNVKAHSTKATYKLLTDGKFVDNRLPTCGKWDELWHECCIQINYILLYLRSENVIDEVKYSVIYHRIKYELPSWNITQISSLYPKTLLSLYGDLNNAIEELTQTVQKLKEEVKQLPFDLKFSLQEVGNGGMISYLFEVFGLSSKHTLSEEELGIGTDLSNRLEKYVEEFFMAAVGNVTVALNGVMPNSATPLYQFIIKPINGHHIPECYVKCSSPESQQLWARFQRFIQENVFNAIGVHVTVKCHFWRLGSIVLEVSFTEVCFPYLVVELPEDIQLNVDTFNFKGMVVSSFKEIPNESENIVTYSFSIYYTDHLLKQRINEEISKLQNNIHVPYGQAGK